MKENALVCQNKYVSLYPTTTITPSYKLIQIAS